MNATRSKPEEKTGTPEKTLLESLQDFLASIRFAIILLACIALGSILGTVIRQGGTPDEYLSVYSEGTYRIITFLGLDDVYHSSWFYALLFLFAVNLTLCTVRRFGPLFRGSRKVSIPDREALAKMPMNFSVTGSSTDDQFSSLLRGYRCIHSDEEGKVFQKGSLSRYGVVLIHLSIMLILVGGLVGLVAGFKGFMVLRKGDVADSVTIRGEKTLERPLGFALKCKDFQVSFYPNGSPKDYVSTVEVVENNRTIFEKQIRVNDPLSYKGIRVYQASYGNTPSFHFTIGGERITLREREPFRKDDFVLMPVRFEENIHNFGPGVMVAYLDQGEPRTAWFLKNMERFNAKTISGKAVRLENIQQELYTGLSVSKDPGVWIVWTGFALILFGLYINFYMFHRKIYIRKIPDGYLVAGIAMRNKEAFRKEFEAMKRGFYGASS